MKITGIILTKNEEKRIKKAVESISFCDEVLVIDDESTDRTVELARESHARVLIHPKKNEFAGQRNWAMEQAKNEWILFVDADEEVSEELKNELLSLSATNYELRTTNYTIPRRDFFWGKEMKWGETKKARTQGIVRLIKKGTGVWTGAVHERYISTGEVGVLNGFLNHYSHSSLSEFIQDINLYSTIRAHELATQGEQGTVFQLIMIPMGKFFYTYVLLGGILDGPEGFVYSFVMSFHSFLVRAKLISQYV